MIDRGHRGRRRAGAAAVAAAGVILTMAATLPMAHAAPAAGTFRSASGFRSAETIERTYVENGVSTVVDKRHVSVSVSDTQELRNRQEIRVSWKGAHPTGNITANPDLTETAQQQEYPVVLMQCRGQAARNAPTAERITPQTCWTVTPGERSQSDQTFDFPPYRVDQYASVADRAKTVGVPTKIPAACGATAESGVQHWVPFDALGGKVWGYGPSGCAGLPPEASFNDPTSPSNTVYAVTSPDGTGSWNFVINTDESNPSLGCSDRVACALVVVPIMGISCDPVGFGLPLDDQPSTSAQEKEAASECETNGNYLPGQLTQGVGTGQLAVSGSLWWSASNWRNRIQIPLSFAQPDNACALINNSTPQDIYGSPLMTQAALQWSPHFCTDPKLFTFQHVITAEPEAKNLLAAGSIQAAFQALPPENPYKSGQPFQRPTVQAPTALTGFSVVYLIDNKDGTQYLHLRLDARLLAKLLTESYPAAATVQQEYPALRHNPLDLAADPEFQALNPGLPTSVQHNDAAATILTLSSDSDITYALTQYINNNPEARAWLNGKPDPWGMTVNPAYKGIALPVTQFPLLDTFIPAEFYNQNPCLKSAPIPYLPLVAAPLESQAQITLDMQYGISNSQTVCADPNDTDEHLAAVGTESPGQRFLLAITSLADAQRYNLSSAQLETSGGSPSSGTFTSAAGRTFVGPTTAGLRAGAAALQWSNSGQTWELPYPSLDRSARGRAAYPGTMLVSTDVPTTGLPPSVAKDYAQFLQFAAGAGQTPGASNGQLPAGYLPMTNSNGLSAEVKYTDAAARAVAEQAGTVPNKNGGLPRASNPGTGGNHNGGNPGGSSGGSSTGSTSHSGSGVPVIKSPGTAPGVTPSVAPTTSGGSTAQAGSTGITAVFAAAGWSKRAVPLAAIIVLVAGAAMIAMHLAQRRKVVP